LGAFLLYGSSDLLDWRMAFYETRRAWKTGERGTLTVGLEYALIRGITKPVSVLRATFEFALPVFVAIYAITALLGAR